jgi:hypothetical protein
MRMGEKPRQHAIRLACLAACVVAVLAAAAGSGASGASLQRVTVFGDSQLASVAATPAATALLATGVDLDLRAAVCRRLVQDSCPYQGARPPTVLDEVRDVTPPLGSTVVVLVGYNDYEDQFVRDVGTVMRALVARDVTRVLWLTLTERRPDWSRMNDLLRSTAKGWPQLEVLEWKEAAASSWFRDDDIHMTPEGAIGLARYIHAALEARGIAAPTASASPPVNVALRISVRGTGTVIVKGTRCRSSCSRLLAVGSVVKLAAKAPAGSVFARWGGACAGTRASCTLKVSRDASVVARFRPKPS